MNATLKNILTISAKNAVNAVLTNSALMAMLHGAFNVTTKAGWWNIGKVTLAVIGSREAMIWLPRLLKWSANTEPQAPQT